MRSRVSRRTAARTLLALTAAAGVVAAAAPTLAARAGAARPGARRIPTVQVVTPLGLQGERGTGERVPIVLRVADTSRNRVVVDVEYGVDLNGDGQITEANPAEFRRATQERRDARDTSRPRFTRGFTDATFRTARDGAAGAFVWNTAADLPLGRHLSGQQLLRTPQGRTVRNPIVPTELLFDPTASAGVVVRVRAHRLGRRAAASEWVYTRPFSVDNSTPPAAAIEAVGPVDAVGGTVAIDWRAFHDDSEDKNGNGVLDVLDLEDVNGNDALDIVPVAIAFDFHRVDPGEVIPTGSAQLALLDWHPCTRRLGQGDPDDGVASAPTGVGREATFVWDFVPDLGTLDFAAGTYIVRATPYDDRGNLGTTVYSTAPVVIPAE